MSQYQPDRRVDTPVPVVVSAAATLLLFQNYVRLLTAGGAFTLTLPSVAAAIGVTFHITKIDASLNACTLVAGNDAEDWSNLTLDAANDSVVVKSDGFKWHILSNEIA